MCAPYLSQPIYGFDLQLLRRLQKVLGIVGMYRIIAQPFIMVIKGLPFIVTGDLSAIDGPPIAQAEIPDEVLPGAGLNGGSPPRSGNFGAPPSGSPYRVGHFAGSPSGASTYSGSPYCQGHFGPHSKQ